MKNKSKKISKDCLTCGYFVVDKNGELDIDMWVDGLKGMPFNQAVCSTVFLKSYFTAKHIIMEEAGKLDNETKKLILKAYEDMTKALLKKIKEDLYGRD